MPTYHVPLKRHEEVAQRTTAFYFKKPAEFQFKPGQFLNLILLDPPETDAEGNARSFSIASAPEEDDLMLTTRMRDTAFKRVLGQMSPGTEVKIAGPFGSFTLHRDESRPAVILTGGIGVTPFRSMVVSAARNKLPHRLFLFYSNRRPEDAAFLDELQQLEKENPNYRFVATMTGLQRSEQAWNGKTGYINREMLSEVISVLRAPIYYSAGPPEMVAAMRKLLEESAVSEDDIRTEDFSGY
jgi:ferredoxin-NADP reductase